MNLGEEDLLGKSLSFQIIGNVFHYGPGKRNGKQGRRDDPFRPLIIEVKRIGIADSRRIIHNSAGVDDGRCIL